MIKILVSNLNHYHKVDGKKVANEIDNKNGLVRHIKKYLKNNSSILFISADSKDIEKNDLYSSLLFEALKMSGIVFEKYNVLNDETKNNAKEFVEKADLIFLSGGSTYNQNMFFEELNLKDLLKNYDGIIIGQSAGALNMAVSGFNSPEEMKDSEPIYFEGLGLTDLNIEPHFILDDSDFNESEVYQRNYILKESKNRVIYALCDTSHILLVENEAIIYGESYVIKNGVIVKISEDCSNYNIYE